MAKELTKTKTDKHDKAILSGIDKEIKKGMTKEEKVELKSYAIKKALKIQKYVRN